MTQVMYLDVYWRLVELLLLVTVLWRLRGPAIVKCACDSYARATFENILQVRREIRQDGTGLRTELRKLRGLLKVFAESAVAEQRIVLREAERLEEELRRQEFAKKLELLSLSPDRPIGGAVRAYYDELEQQYKETLNMEAPVNK